MIRAPRPRIVSVRRLRPGQTSLGDWGEARLDPGLIALLATPLGAGFHAGYNVPVNLAATAALAVLAPATRRAPTGSAALWKSSGSARRVRRSR